MEFDRLHFASQGPATRVQTSESEDRTEEVESLAIDDLVSTESIAVDFIKMDIEGAELEALRGTEATLRQQRPKLAISVYHRIQDIVEIPAYLASLDLGYRFYLGSSTIFECEVVLFAVARTDRGTLESA